MENGAIALGRSITCTPTGEHALACLSDLAFAQHPDGSQINPLPSTHRHSSQSRSKNQKMNNRFLNHPEPGRTTKRFETTDTYIYMESHHDVVV